MSWRESAQRTGRRLVWLRGEPDPLAVQLAFMVLLHLAVLGRELTHGEGPSAPVLWAIRLGDLTLVLTFLVAHRVRNTNTVVGVLANVDLALLGLTALEHDTGTLPLVVLPAMWLAGLYRWRALWRVFLSTTVLVALPATIVYGDEHHTATQLMLLPFIATVAASSIAIGLDAAERARSEAEQQRREAQRALAELAGQRLANEAIVETVDVGLVLLDANGDVWLRNEWQAQVEKHVYPAGRGRSLPQHVYGADSVTALSQSTVPSAVAARGEEFDDFRLWVGPDPSTRRAMSVSARQVYDEEGRRIGAALVYKDITELMRALSMKDDLIALVSHELRTPLTSIYGYVSILCERDDLPPEASRHLSVVARNAGRLDGLVAELLEAARVIGGVISLKPTRTDLAALVRRSVESAAPRARAAGVELAVEAPAYLAAVVDRTRMAQVVDNLVSNAVKYTPAGGWARVELNTFPDRVELRVADSGIGIGAEELDQLFETFFRTQEASERAIQGVGLGLSIVRSIVECHGGRIDVASRPGHGSVFTVVLPAERREDVELPSAS